MTSQTKISYFFRHKTVNVHRELIFCGGEGINHSILIIFGHFWSFHFSRLFPFQSRLSAGCQLKIRPFIKFGPINKMIVKLLFTTIIFALLMILAIEPYFYFMVS